MGSISLSVLKRRFFFYSLSPRSLLLSLSSQKLEGSTSHLFTSPIFFFFLQLQVWKVPKMVKEFAPFVLVRSYFGFCPFSSLSPSLLYSHPPPPPPPFLLPPISPSPGHYDTITSMCWCPDSKHFVTGSGDRTARLWALSSNNFLEDVQMEVFFFFFPPLHSHLPSSHLF